MRLNLLVSLLAVLPLLLHAQEDPLNTEDNVTYERPSESRPTIAWYIDMTLQEHDDRAAELRSTGFRPLSLSGYGNPGETQYAATWINDGKYTDSWQMAWGLSKDDFDDWVHDWTRKGFRLVMISANGPADKAEFHGVMGDQTVWKRWAWKCDIKDLDEYMADKDKNGLSRVVSFRMYGEIGERRYCVVLHENENNERWALEHNDEGLMPDKSWTTEFNYPSVSRQFLRPAKLFMSDDGVVTPLMTDLSVGGWSAAVRLNKTELVQFISDQGDQWFLPVDIQGASGLGRTQFNAIFAQRMKYQPRRWAVRGEISSFKNNTLAKEQLDSMMKTFMQKNGVRQAQVAIGARGHVMAERSYTWAETAYGTVQTNDTFLLGGVSKMFTYAAVKWCVENSLIDYDTPVYKLLGYYNPFDERAEDITIQHLLDHTSGYDRGQSGEAAFEFGKIGMQLPTKGKKPATLDDVIQYKLKQKLDYNPGERMVHSHYGSLLLGAVIANLTEMPYIDFLEKHILDGLDVSVFKTDADAHVRDKIVQEGLQIGVDARYPAKEHYVPGVYGGDGAIKEECAAAFSLRSSASSLVKFADKHSVARMGKRRNGYRRGGIEGGYAFVESHGDFDWAMVFNTREFASKDEILDLAHNKMGTFLDNTLSENRYGPYTFECNPGPEIFDKAFPGLLGISRDTLEHLPACTKEQLDEILHDRSGLQ